jgi:hypothetical protein
MDRDGSPFSWGQWIYSTLLTTMRKIAMHGLREIRMVEGHTRTERGMCVTWLLGFPYRVYIDSNHRDSQI